MPATRRRRIVRIAVMALAVMGLFTLAVIFVREGTAADVVTGLTLAIEFPKSNDARVVELDAPLRVILTNTEDKARWVCNPASPKRIGSLWIRFKNARTGEQHVVEGDPDNNEERTAFDDPPTEALELAPRESFAMHFDLSAFTQGDPPLQLLPDPNTNDQYLITAVFESSGGTATGGTQIWKGTVESEAYRTRFTANRLDSPSDYIAFGFTKRAIALMEEDPSWLRRARDSQLNVAVAYHNLAAVKWLVEHGADVDGALQGADDIEIVKLILTRHPDLNLAEQALGRTPLQEAAANLAEARNDADRQKWRTIVQLYRDAGADYDVRTAIWLGDLNQVKARFDRTAVRTDGFYEENPLRLAASLGQTDICRYLIEEHHVDVNAFDQGNGYPIIKDALAFPDVVRLLIENGADLQTRITWRAFRTGIWIVGDDATALHYAAEDGVPETLTLLIDSGVDVFATARSLGEKVGTQSALDVAAYLGKAGNARAILNHPRFREGDAELRQNTLDRCLGFAAQCNWLSGSANSQRPDLITALLEHGANPKSPQFASTALQLAAQSIHPNSKEQNETTRKIVNELVAHGAKLDLFTAVALGDEAEVARLLQADPSTANTRGADGYPALHKAVTMNYSGIVSRLIGAGGDIEIRNQSQMTGSIEETGLHCAAFWGRVDIAKLLIDAGADVNARDERGATPLHEAARLANVHIASLLLEHGAQVDAADNDGATPLDDCRSAGSKNADEMEKLLRRYQHE